MSAGSLQRKGWLSYYVILDGDPDAFLTEYLAPLVLEETRAGHLKRFFFIRYTEERLQLRLRFLPAGSDSITRIINRISGTIETFNGRLPEALRALLSQ